MYIEVGRALLAVRCWWRARVLSTRFRRWSVTSAVSWVCGSVRPSSLPQRSSSLSGTSSTSSSTCALVDAVGERPTREKLPSVEPTTTSDTDWPLSDSFFTRDSRMLRASLPSSGRLSVCLSHSWIVSKRCKLGSRNLHCGLPRGL